MATTIAKPKRLRLPPGSILGTFGKGAAGSISINFSLSGSDSCDDSCGHKGIDCYAERIEIRPDRAQLTAKLRRHGAMKPALLAGRALVELQRLVARGQKPPWVRISTAGSLPQPSAVRADRLFRAQLLALIGYCKSQEIPIHIPVESYAKARFYRAWLGDLAVVRESAQSRARFINAKGAVSATAGAVGMPLMQRVEAARDLAAARRSASGRRAIVCPAVVAGFRTKLAREANAKAKAAAGAAKAKCGNCTACANPCIDVVYPLH